MNKYDINVLCSRIVNFYNQEINGEINYNEYNINKTKEMNRLLKKLLLVVNSNLVKDLNHNYSAYYYIYIFCLIYKEDLLNQEDILNLSKIGNFFNILELNKKLSNEIICEILSSIKKNSKKYNLGPFPYDYRYHIIKRDEIHESIKEEVISLYSNEEINELLKAISNDLNLFYCDESFDYCDTFIREKDNVYKRLSRVI